MAIAKIGRGQHALLPLIPKLRFPGGLGGRAVEFDRAEIQWPVEIGKGTAASKALV